MSLAWLKGEVLVIAEAYFPLVFLTVGEINAEDFLLREFLQGQPQTHAYTAIDFLAKGPLIFLPDRPQIGKNYSSEYR